mmetsp:Transcript_49989/g.118947  ORF Transcript_49989/g.118947 Transcript_49989/m.118947 type:complete len:222 (+) Transcript_49989:3-668(+)
MSKMALIFCYSNKSCKGQSDSMDTFPLDQKAVAEVTMKLPKFIECIIRVAREQIPGRDNLPKKLTSFLSTMHRHAKGGSRQDVVQLTADANVAKVVKKHLPIILRVYRAYAEEDISDAKSTMNLRELFQLVKDLKQMDSKFGISKLATAFCGANAAMATGDDGTWEDWDWELDYEEFQEILVRITDMKTKTAEGQLSEKVDSFLANVVGKLVIKQAPKTVV